MYVNIIQILSTFFWLNSLYPDFFTNSMNYDIFGLGEARAIWDILQSCFTYKALLLANYLFPTIFESVDEHNFLKIWGPSDLRPQKYAEVAENSLGLIKNFSITKTWFFKLLQVARLMAYPETLNWHQNFSLALRRPRPRKSDIPPWQPPSTF